MIKKYLYALRYSFWIYTYARVNPILGFEWGVDAYKNFGGECYTPKEAVLEELSYWGD